jgi:alkanesulfonate monooxygenase SsuD/methylene tetrahydromethanopterin reductase-like flavin-dependent oxidoreductase (luciferase family)
MWVVDAGIHLPLIDFAGEGFSVARLNDAVDAARDGGMAAISANDHFLFSAPWLDGPTALAAVVARSGDMQLATTISLPTLRGPVPLAKALATLDILCAGRLVAGLGPGSSQRDYAAVGVPFEQRWQRLDESIALLRALLSGTPVPDGDTFYAVPDGPLTPLPHQRGGPPLFIGSWGSPAGLRRVARSGDGWLASAYNTTPEDFGAKRLRLEAELAAADRPAVDFPNALVTMWTWITEDRSDAERMLTEVLAPMLNRDPDYLRERVCIGSMAACEDLLARYAAAGCQRVYFWPLGDVPRQIEQIAQLMRGRPPSGS